jgi:hypothetical protein
MWRRVDLVWTEVSRRHIPEDGILYSQRRENLKSYTLIVLFIPFIQNNQNLNIFSSCSQGLIKKGKDMPLIDHESL